MTYPRRPPFFALKFVRKLLECGVANELGPDCFTLLTAIASMEDVTRYTGAVRFWNNQLALEAGCGSVDTLARVRTKCVNAGWLHYEPGRKGSPAGYWCIVPKRYAVNTKRTEDLGDMFRTGADESAEQSEPSPQGGEGPVLIRNGAEQSAEQSAEQCAEHSSLVPLPIPKEPPASAGVPAASGSPSPVSGAAVAGSAPPEGDTTGGKPTPAKSKSRVLAPGAEKPRTPLPTDPYFDAIVRLVGDGFAVSAGGRIVKMAAAMIKAGLPVEALAPERFRAVIQKNAPWRLKSAIELNTVQECWPWLLNDPPNPPHSPKSSNPLRDVLAGIDPATGKPEF